MQWAPMDRAVHPPTSHFFQKGVAIDVQLVQAQANGEKMPGVDSVFRKWRQLDLLDARQFRAVVGRDGLPFKPHRLGAAKLMQPDTGSDVGEVIFVARSDDAVVPASVGPIAVPGVMRKAVEGHLPHPFRQLRAVRDGHAAFAGGDRLVGIEGKAGDVRGAFPIISEKRKQILKASS